MQLSDKRKAGEANFSASPALHISYILVFVVSFSFSSCLIVRFLETLLSFTNEALSGFAAFQVLGWNFPGMSWNNQTYPGAGCKGTCKGIIGKFTTFVSLDDAFSLGGANLGASIITLSD